MLLQLDEHLCHQLWIWIFPIQTERLHSQLQWNCCPQSTQERYLQDGSQPVDRSHPTRILELCSWTGRKLRNRSLWKIDPSAQKPTQCWWNYSWIRLDWRRICTWRRWNWCRWGCTWRRWNCTWIWIWCRWNCTTWWKYSSPRLYWPKWPWFNSYPWQQPPIASAKLIFLQLFRLGLERKKRSRQLGQKSRQMWLLLCLCSCCSCLVSHHGPERILDARFVRATDRRLHRLSRQPRMQWRIQG